MVLDRNFIPLNAITDIITTAYENMNNNYYTGLIFLNLKYLGVYLDNKRTFGSHISYLQLKLTH